MSNLSHLIFPVKIIIEKSPLDIRYIEKNFTKAGRISNLAGGNKSVIKEFSLRSRKKSRFMMRSASRGMVTVMCLTYPLELHDKLDGRKVKKHLDIFFKAYRREFGRNVRYCWVLEFQKNGNPHFHIMTDVRPTSIEDHDLWVRRKWFDIVDSKLMKHFDQGVRGVELIRTQDGCADYMIKYLGKDAQKCVPDHFQNVGRFWGGSRNAWSIEKEEYEFPDTFEGIADARRTMRTIKRARSSKLRCVSRETGIKYILPRSGGGFVMWGGRALLDQIQVNEQGLIIPGIQMTRSSFSEWAQQTQPIGVAADIVPF